MSSRPLEPITLRDHLRLLRRRGGLLLGVVGLCFAVAAAYVLLGTPIYQARATLVVANQSGPRAAVLSAAAPVLSMLGDPVSSLGGDDLATQVEIIDSRPSLETAWGLMNDHPDLLRRLVSAGMSDELLEELPGLIERLPVQPPPLAWPEPWQEVLDTLHVGPVADAELIEVRLQSADREQARDFVNALALSYLGRSLSEARSTTRRTRRYVEEQIADTEARLAEAEESLRLFGEDAGTVALDESARQQIGLLVRLSEQASVAESTMKARAAMREELSARLEGLDATVVAATIMRRTPEIPELQVALAEAEAERVALLEEYASESMPVRSAAARVDELRRGLESTAAEVVDSRQEALNPVAQEVVQELILAEAEQMAAEQSLRVLRRAAGGGEAELAGLPAEQVRLLKLQREMQLLERVYLALKEKQQEYEIAEQTRGPSARLVEHAIAADRPIRPRPVLTLAAGIAAGLLLGLLSVVLVEQLDERLHEPERLAEASGLPVLACLGGRWRDGAPDEASAAALRSLLRQTVASSLHLPAPSMLVLAEAEGGDDAPAVARALAAVAAEEGRRALVISLDTGDGAPGEAGLDQVLQGRSADQVSEILLARGVDLALIVPPGGSGVLAALPLVTADRPVLLVADLRRASSGSVLGVRMLAEQVGGRLMGIVATGGGRSSSRYYPPRGESCV